MVAKVVGVITKVMEGVVRMLRLGAILFLVVHCRRIFLYLAPKPLYLAHA